MITRPRGPCKICGGLYDIQHHMDFLTIGNNVFFFLRCPDGKGSTFMGDVPVIEFAQASVSETIFNTEIHKAIQLMKGKVK